MSLRKIISQYKNPIAEVGTGVALGGGVAAAASNKENKKLKAGIGALAGGLATRRLGTALRSRGKLGEYAVKRIEDAKDRSKIPHGEIRGDLLKQYESKKDTFVKDIRSKATGFNPFGIRTKKLKKSMPKDYISQKELASLKEKQLSSDIDSVLNQESLKKYREDLDNYHRSRESVFAKMNKSEQTEHLRGKDNIFTMPVLDFRGSPASFNLQSPEKLQRLRDRLPKIDRPVRGTSLRRNIVVALESEAKRNHQRRMAELRKRFPDRGIK